LTQGQKSNDVIRHMANTFKALCEYADFETPNKLSKKFENHKQDEDSNQQEIQDKDVPRQDQVRSNPTTNVRMPPQLHYNIQIILPETRDPQVYDAIFRSLKEHLY